MRPRNPEKDWVEVVNAGLEALDDGELLRTEMTCIRFSMFVIVQPLRFRFAHTRIRWSQTPRAPMLLYETEGA